MTLRFLTHSHCIWDLDLRCKLEAAMSGRASLLEAKLMIPGTEMTFLEFSADQELCYYWVCARCAQTPKEKASNMVRGCDPWRADNLARHASTKQHQAALQKLGFLPEDDAPPLEAPDVDQFLKVVNRKPAESLRSGVAGIGGAKKVLKMLRCLAQATLHIDSSTLASAESIMLQVDIRDMKLCVRFQACTEDLKVHRGVLGFESVCSNSHEEVMRGIQKALTRLCSLEGTLDDEALEARRAVWRFSMGWSFRHAAGTDRAAVFGLLSESEVHSERQSTLCAPNPVPTMVSSGDNQRCLPECHSREALHHEHYSALWSCGA